MLGEYKLNTLYNEDSTKAIKKLPDNCIDVILIDPPYGIKMDKGATDPITGFGQSKGKVKIYEEEWDSEIPTDEMFKDILRVGKTVIVFGGNYFAHMLPRATHWVVWDKKGHLAFDNPFSDCELIWTNLQRKNVKKYTNISQGFISDGDERIHPTQKPLRLITDILRDYTKDGDIVADFYSGSGTTAVACRDLGLKWIAFEKDTSIYERSQQRLSGITKDGQTSIFTFMDGDDND
ncbi:site-specific DNA-methyltransferase [Erysipelothrix sp. HDW6C]|uniref:DNA-methyltransferase n=1 Tax=Erysipelothrix sp. HDW6C TaxID=2714930 RepID=UPI001409792F|nr:site-specific DNA-methyltransferase [Erysipelothrix sp. HDW6C]QIK70861.1 site-specific DNA-methyltransferase [Erysipelothrix sp. HDW6C]